MKTIEEIFDFEPQISKSKPNKELSLNEILYNYYIDNGIRAEKAESYVLQYIEALKEFIK
jgi:hypothetical protein